MGSQTLLVKVFQWTNIVKKSFGQIFRRFQIFWMVKFSDKVLSISLIIWNFWIFIYFETNCIVKQSNNTKGFIYNASQKFVSVSSISVISVYETIFFLSQLQYYTLNSHLKGIKNGLPVFCPKAVIAALGQSLKRKVPEEAIR